MRISVRLMGYLRLEFGREVIDLELPDVASVAEAVAMLSRVLEPDASHSLLVSSQGDPNVLFSVNRRIVEAPDTLSEGDDLVLYPPSAGGGPRVVS